MCGRDELFVTPNGLIPVSVAVDDKNAYVTCPSAGSSGSLRRMALDGSGEDEIATSANGSYRSCG